MKFMILVKATRDSEAGVLPSEQLLAEMGNYNEELAKAGVLVAGEGLHPSSKGARVRFSGKERLVIDGPFVETKELIAGFWLWQVNSLEEAIEWVKRCPNPHNEETEIEIRQVFEADDFGEAFTPELREQEERLRERLEQSARRTTVSKMNSVVHFEMPYDDRERMAKFYQSAFGWQTQMLGEEMGNYVLATTTETDESGPTKPGAINGGFFPKRSDWPAQYPSVVIAVDDVQAAMRQVTEAGGKVLGEPMEIPGVGQYVSFFDPERNRVSMLQPFRAIGMRRSRNREESMPASQKITPCLWFDSEAEEAARFYVSVFQNARIGRISRYGKEGFDIHGRPEGSVMTVEFELEGQSFTALNGGPHFKFNEAISFQIPCETQEEIDHYWERLSEGGQIQQCGWLKDKFDVSWQIFPSALPEMLQDSDKAKAARAMRAMLGMKKFDIAELRAAYEGK